MNQEGKAKLILDGKEIELPIHVGTENERAIDITQLRAKTGYITYDPGLGNTGTTSSKITFIDGEKGILRYRGYPIEELAEKSRFIEVSYLILYGELPTADQLRAFSKQLNISSMIHEDMQHFFTGFPYTAHPMGILSTMIAALSTFYPIPEEFTDEDEKRIMVTLISQVRTIAAMSYKMFMGEPMVYPSYKLRYVENFLNMMFQSPVADYQIDPDFVRAIDLFLVLHAEHEQNCSTSAVRTVGSSKANVYAVISSGIAALWGPLHGGANQSVIEMLTQIHKEGGSGIEFVNRAKDKNTSDRLMGFGHRVYRSYDPRAKILKEHCHKLLNKPGVSDPLFDIALKLEEIALTDDYFISRNLYPNVDFYSGLILKAVGIPVNMFTVLFTIGRMPGWLAQWSEMRKDGGNRITRPRQVYDGYLERSYIPIEERAE